MISKMNLMNRNFSQIPLKTNNSHNKILILVNLQLIKARREIKLKISHNRNYRQDTMKKFKKHMKMDQSMMEKN